MPDAQLSNSEIAAAIAEALNLVSRYEAVIEKILDMADANQDDDLSYDVMRLFSYFGDKLDQLKKLEKVRKLVLEAANL